MGCSKKVCRRDMNIKTAHFCGLSSATDFRSWLKTASPDLYDELNNIPVKGCRAKQDKMIQIKDKLYAMGKGGELESFIQRRYPYMVQQDAPASKTPSKPLEPIKPKPQMRELKRTDHINSLNKHKVFKHYRPDLLTFPHKYIIVGDPIKLPELVKSFVLDKVGVDHVIVDDHAYIEYFTRRYSDIAEKIKSEDREIWIYKQRQKQSASLS